MSAIAQPAGNVVTAAIATVSQIDLTPINESLQYENPAQWTDECVARVEVLYRRFLALHLLYPSEIIVPNKLLDEYWHQHILDTQKYASDCETVFGFYLHHDPYFGNKGEEDRRQNLEAFAATQRMWEEAFGESLVGESKLTIDKVLGSGQSETKGLTRQRVYAFPQRCKNGQHCKSRVTPPAGPAGGRD